MPDNLSSLTVLAAREQQSRMSFDLVSRLQCANSNESLPAWMTARVDHIMHWCFSQIFSDTLSLSLKDSLL